MLGKQSGVDAGKKQRSQLLCALHISYLIARHAPRPGHAAPGAASADRKIIGFYASTVKMSAHDEKEGTVGVARWRLSRSGGGGGARVVARCCFSRRVLTC